MKFTHYLLIGSLIATPAFVGAADKSDKEKAKSQRILTVDIEKAYQSYYKANAAQVEFEKSVEAARSEITKMEGEWGDLYKEAQASHEKAQNPALTEDAKKKLETDASAKEEVLRKKGMEMEQFKEETGQRLRQKNQEIVAQYVDELKAILSKMVEEKKAAEKKADVDFVMLNSTGLGVLYAPANLDVTQELIDRSNADQPKTPAVIKDAKPAKDAKKGSATPPSQK